MVKRFSSDGVLLKSAHVSRSGKRHMHATSCNQAYSWDAEAHKSTLTPARATQKAFEPSHIDLPPLPGILLSLAHVLLQHN